MKTNLFILVVIILLSGCSKQENEPTCNFYAKTYIKNLISVDTANAYKGIYYIHVSLRDLVTSEKKELTFDQTTHNMISKYDPYKITDEMLMQGTLFQNKKSMEELRIAFYIPAYPDSTFKICYANYIFGSLWTIAGANVEYFKVDANSYFNYNCINTSSSYFKITYIGTNQINGVFHTTWNNNYTVKSVYDVDGDFSIPRIRS
jgi:hypothetical protein